MPTQTPTASASSTTTTTVNTATATPLLVYTKSGTPLAAFQALVSDLDSDWPYARELVFPLLDWQIYVVSLDAEQIKRAEANPIVEGLVSDAFISIPDNNLRSSFQKRDQAEPVDDRLFKPPSEHTHNSTSTGTGTLKKRAVVTQVASPDSLKLLSKPASGEGLEYTYDNAVAGNGVMIYAIDTGVLLSHQVRTSF